MDYTTNLNLKKPNGEVDGDFVLVEDLNSNFDAIDTAIGGHTADIATLDTRLDKKEIPNTATLTAAGWSASAPYTQTVAVTGITAGRLPDKIIPQYSATLATAILQREAYCMISHYDTGAGTITFTCLEDKPVTDIPLQIVGV